MFKVHKGLTRLEMLPVTTSQANGRDSLMEFTSGLLDTADSTDVNLAGVLVKAIVAADADYATARKVAVRIPRERHVVWEADASGSFVAGDIGAEFGISDANTVDHTNTTNKVFLVTEVISATKVRGYLKINQAY